MTTVRAVNCILHYLRLSHLFSFLFIFFLNPFPLHKIDLFHYLLIFLSTLLAVCIQPRKYKVIIYLNYSARLVYTFFKCFFLPDRINLFCALRPFSDLTNKWMVIVFVVVAVSW